MENEPKGEDLLYLLAIKIQTGDYSEKPEYTGLTMQEILDQKIQIILPKISQITKYSLISPLEILYKQKYEKAKERDKCPICLCEFYDDILNEFEKNPSNVDFLVNIPFEVILLEKCEDHFFHIECLNDLIGEKNSFKCPICSKIYGILEGDMPHGTFSAYKTSQKCSGYNCDTIVINYNFPNGPGYTGTHRTAYLPNNKEGREVLALLKTAFDRKLTFTVGTSITTGRKNTVIWNGIHHKTNLYGGSTNFGYPDKSYFNRVKEELAAKGVTKESVKGDLEDIAKKILND